MRIVTHWLLHVGLTVTLAASLFTCSRYEPPVWPVPPGSAPNNSSSGPLPPQVQQSRQRRIFIENRQVRLGIDLNMGGAITYLSEVNKPNMVNNFDYGRQIQTSLYSGPIPYSVNGKQPFPQLWPLGWNPVQAGDFYNHGSRVLEYRQDSTRLYVKSIPMQWPLFNQPADCIMEHWLELQGNVVRVRSRTTINRPDTTQYSARPQETPAVYLNGPYFRKFTYDGDRPFTGAPAREVRIDNTAEISYSAENWVALIDKDGRGLGLWQPNNHRYMLGFFGRPGSGDEYSQPTGYLAGAELTQLDYRSVFEHEYALVLGTVDDVRQFVYQQPRPRMRPDFRFTQDRQGWFYDRTTDQGLPIRGELRVGFDGNQYMRMSSPNVFYRGSEIPKLYLDAAFRTKANTARIQWRHPGDFDFLPLPSRYIDFPIVNDGQFRVYEIDMTQNPGWQGVNIQLSILPTKADTVRSGQYVRIRSLTTTRP